MKERLFLFLAFVLLSTAKSLSGNNITVKSGNILFFNEQCSAMLKFDYGSMEVNDSPFNDFMEEKGGDEYREKWDKWIKEAEKAFIEDFNKRTPGIRFEYNSKTPAYYSITIKVKTLKTGNAAEGFLPSLSFKMKEGVPEMNGVLYVKDNKGKDICTLVLKNITGVASLNTSSRLMTLYMALSKKIRKTVGKASKL